MRKTILTFIVLLATVSLCYAFEDANARTKISGNLGMVGGYMDGFYIDGFGMTVEFEYHLSDLLQEVPLMDRFTVGLHGFGAYNPSEAALPLGGSIDFKYQALDMKLLKLAGLGYAAFLYQGSVSNATLNIPQKSAMGFGATAIATITLMPVIITGNFGISYNSLSFSTKSYWLLHYGGNIAYPLSKSLSLGLGFDYSPNKMTIGFSVDLYLDNLPNLKDDPESSASEGYPEESTSDSSDDEEKGDSDEEE